jgi:hypothetical protein
MRSPLARGAIALAAVAAIVVLFVVLAGGDDDGGGGEAATTQAPPTGTTGAAERDKPEPAKPTIERIVVEGGKPRGGVKRLSFDRGDRIRFLVESDIADEVHVHGYDISKDVPAGGSVRFSFPARLEGVFEVELEGRHEQIAELRVNP